MPNLPNLSGSNIQDTYQRVLHTDGTLIYNGTGSVISNMPTTASFAVTASHALQAVVEITKEVTSSYAETASMASDSFIVQGEITASGNISASGTITADKFIVPFGSSIIGEDSSGNTNDVIVTNTADSFGVIFGDSDHSAVLAGAAISLDSGLDIHLNADGGDVTFADGTGGTKVNINTTEGHITASGNISASGDMHASNFILPANGTIAPSTNNQTIKFTTKPPGAVENGEMLTIGPDLIEAKGSSGQATLTSMLRLDSPDGGQRIISFNNDSADIDFSIQSDNLVAFKLDAANDMMAFRDYVGIGNSANKWPTDNYGLAGTPTYQLMVMGKTKLTGSVEIEGPLTASGIISSSGTGFFENLDVDGTTNLDAVDIDGNVQLDGTFTVGVNGNGKDVKFYGQLSNRYIQWDQSVNQLKFQDNTRLAFGTGAAEAAFDSSIIYDASNLIIDSDTGIQLVSDNNKIEITGNITASGNISASATLIANEANIIGNITASGDITSSGDILANSFLVYGIGGLDSNPDGTLLRLDGGGQFSDGISYGRPGILSNHHFNGHITASGNISASGDIINTGNIIVGDKILLTDSTTADYIDYVGSGFLYKGNGKFSGNITASFNISASEKVFADQFEAGTAYRLLDNSEVDRHIITQYSNFISLGNTNFSGINITGSMNAVSSSFQHLEIEDQLVHSGDPETRMRFSSDTIYFDVGGASAMLTIAEDNQDIVTIGNGNDIDFKVRTLNDDNLIFAQGDTDRVGIGTDTPGMKLDVAGDINATNIRLSGNITASGAISSSFTGENFLGGDLNMVGADIILDNAQKIQFKHATSGAEFGNILMNSSNNMLFQNLKSNGDINLKSGNDSNKGNVIIMAGGTTDVIATFGETAGLNLVGSYTASGDVSSSGTILAQNIIANSDITASGDISASGFITGKEVKIGPDDTARLRYNDPNLEILQGGLKVIGGPVTATRITASGDVSSSGNVYADGFYSNNQQVIDYDGSKIRIGNVPTNIPGNITASGNISSSGNFIGNRQFDKSSDVDNNTTQGDIVYAGGQGTIAEGDIVFMDTSGNWQKARADGASTATSILGIALGSNAGNDGILLRGMFTLDHNVGNDQGVPLYLSDTTAGSATVTAPSDSGDIVRIIGYNLGDDDEIWFDPDKSWVEIS